MGILRRVVLPLALALAASASFSAERRFVVTSRGLSTVSIDGGRVQGVKTGDRLRVVAGERTIAELEVVSVAERWASCRAISLTRPIATGDVVVPLSPASPPPVVAATAAPPAPTRAAAVSPAPTPASNRHRHRHRTPAPTPAPTPTPTPRAPVSVPPPTALPAPVRALPRLRQPQRPSRRSRPRPVPSRPWRPVPSPRPRRAGPRSGSSTARPPTCTSTRAGRRVSAWATGSRSWTPRSSPSSRSSTWPRCRPRASCSRRSARCARATSPG